MAKQQKKQPETRNQGAYTCYGRSHASEQAMLLDFLDEYRCAEAFAAEYIGHWIDVSPREYVKGGLRTIHQRESFHAALLEGRLCALGGSPQCTVPAARREKEFPFYTSPAKSDEEKLQKAVGWIKDPAKAIKPLTDVIDQIADDQQSKQMLRTIIDDELATIKWLQEARELLSTTNAA
jgi:bacterioferritin (cytochrome b1)